MPKQPKVKGTIPRRRKESPATLRSTSGAGFEFEDLVSTWLMVKMLAGEPSPGTGGDGIQLQAQVSAAGWQIDDLLLTSQHAGGTARLAISLKGNVQVTAAGLPADFVARAWAQWRDPAGLMDRQKDHLVLVTRGPHPVFDPTWYEVKNACEGPDKALALARIRSNAKQERVFDSVLQAAPRPTEAEAIELVRHLHVIPLDLQTDHSEIVSTSLAMIRRILGSGDADEAGKVWAALVNTARDVRIKRGTLTRQELWSSVRGSFSLKDHPDYDADWRTLASITADNKGRIETALPSGYALKRLDETSRVIEAVRGHPIVELCGESGSGKSALLKYVADQELADWSHVWLGPEDLRDALSARRRAQLPLGHPLDQVLGATTKLRNLLVIDSAERIPPDEHKAILELIESLVPPTTLCNLPLWHVVIISQSSDRFIGVRTAHRELLGALAPTEVKDAVHSTGHLSWLTAHSDTINALTNLKTLAWVLQANLDWTDGGVRAHHATIADRLWLFWTKGRQDLQGLTMQLALKEADFQRSFALTDIGSAELTAFTGKPPELPLRVNRFNRIEFEHDLAADLARFQWLKQFANEPARWADLAGNPLWSNALRMLGQFLLREPGGSRTAWDEALDVVDAAGPSPAGNLLLDALCLDPEAERFLNERSDRLFANNAAYLDRLLTRFVHIATVPRGLTTGDVSLEIYLDARFRTVIVGRWLPVLRYLIAQRDRLNGVVSVALAKLIETWLTQLPRQTSDGQSIPFRREPAQLALDMARTVQVEKATGVMYLDDTPSLYTAPLSGMGDLPEEIAAWALEMCGRRKRDAQIEQRVSGARRREAVAHAERMRTNPDYKQRHEAVRAIPSTLASMREKLAPWPLGPQFQVERGFRDACLQTGLHHVIAVDPALATELLLALMIEESPERDDALDYRDPMLGLEAARDGFPTAYWKSPFLYFLAVAPNAALTALLSLVDFCTSRWAERMPNSPGLTLVVPAEPERPFIGDGNVFGWGQASSHRNGYLYSALDALEHWLTAKIDAGEDVTPMVERVFRETNSVALLGVLCNVAKYHPVLLTRTLAPLLTAPHLYFWDAARVKAIEYTFHGSQWLRYGESVFESMKRWALAPHRRMSISQVAIDSMLSDASLASWLKAAVSGWTAPADPKEGLELKALQAQLDLDNYRVPESTEASAHEFAMPPDVQEEIDSWESSHSGTVQVLTLPRRCEQRIEKCQLLSDDEAVFLFAALSRHDDDATIEEDFKERARLAAAATLIVLAGDWLERTAGARVQAESVVRRAVQAVESTDEYSGAMRLGASGDDLKFAASAIVCEWIRNKGSPQWEQLLLRLLSSPDHGGTPAVIAECYKQRNVLGASWWRLLQVGMCWAGLASLSPRYGGSASSAHRWSKWRERLIGLRVWDVDATMSSLRLKRISDGCNRLDFRRQLRAFSHNADRWKREPDPHRGPGLDSRVLEGAFGWLVEADGTGDWSCDVELATRLWAHEVEWAQRRHKTNGDLHLPGDTLGYDIVRKLAHLTVDASAGQPKAAWLPIMELGPAADRAIHHFVGALFLELRQGVDPLRFEGVWRELLDYALSTQWGETAGAYRRGRIIGELLGFGHESALRLLGPQGIVRHAAAYERWAKAYLDRDDDCIVGLSAFLKSEVGAGMRPDGCAWIAAALRSGEVRRERVGTALIDLCNALLSEDTVRIVKDEAFRQSLIRIAAWLATHNNAPAMTLQERIKQLR